jgi:hypothetical protein
MKTLSPLSLVAIHKETTLATGKIPLRSKIASRLVTTEAQVRLIGRLVFTQ